MWANLSAGDLLQMNDFIILLIAILLWAMSLYLVGEAAKNQKWAVGSPSGKPETYAGVVMSQLLSVLFILLWMGRVYLSTRPRPGIEQFADQLLLNPGPVLPGLLFAIFPPLLVGMVKQITTIVVSHGELENAVERRNRRWISTVHLILQIGLATAGILLLRTVLN